MSERLSFSFSIVVAIAFALCTILFTEHAVAQTTCPSGTIVITSDLRAMATAAGVPTSANCWDSTDPNSGKAAGSVKQWLEQHASKDANISCLNTQFAEKLQQFMEADPYGVPLITSGYRTTAQQQALIGTAATRVTTACGSYHPWGLAADFNSNNAQQTQWMRANASQYGIATIGTWDPNHFQNAAGKTGAMCGACDATDAAGNYGSQAAPPASAMTGPATDDVPPQSAIEGLDIPAGSCVTSSDPLTVVPCDSLGTPASSGSGTQSTPQGQSPTPIQSPPPQSPNPYSTTPSPAPQLLLEPTSPTPATQSTNNVSLSGQLTAPSTQATAAIETVTNTSPPAMAAIDYFSGQSSVYSMYNGQTEGSGGQGSSAEGSYSAWYGSPTFTDLGPSNGSGSGFSLSVLLSDLGGDLQHLFTFI